MQAPANLTFLGLGLENEQQTRVSLLLSSPHMGNLAVTYLPTPSGSHICFEESQPSPPTSKPALPTQPSIPRPANALGIPPPAEWEVLAAHFCLRSTEQVVVSQPSAPTEWEVC